MEPYRSIANNLKNFNDSCPGKSLTWDFILLEEVYEAISERDNKKLKIELIQVAAVCTAWIESLYK